LSTVEPAVDRTDRTAVVSTVNTAEYCAYTAAYIFSVIATHRTTFQSAIKTTYSATFPPTIDPTIWSTEFTALVRSERPAFGSTF